MSRVHNRFQESDEGPGISSPQLPLTETLLGELIGQRTSKGARFDFSDEDLGRKSMQCACGSSRLRGED